MEKQRLRNLTTRRLHTDISCVYEDLEFITGTGVMTHMIPDLLAAIRPWLIEKVTELEYWDDDYNPTLTGAFPLEPMNEDERKDMLERYEALAHHRWASRYRRARRYVL